jgi:hypothetical protein
MSAFTALRGSFIFKLTGEERWLVLVTGHEEDYLITLEQFNAQ